MSNYQALIHYKQELSKQGAAVAEYFDSDTEDDLSRCYQLLQENEYKVMVVDSVIAGNLDISTCQKLLQHERLMSIPLVVLTAGQNLQDKLKAFEIGCDDYVDSSLSNDEICSRITKSIFNRIANDQLSARLEVANQTARAAMVDNSDLGANIQFLLEVHDCDNFDQLGQQFFASVERYCLNCSLQMRSQVLGTKNMEANGMMKDLESQLLHQLKDSDRYIDFGPRTIINYDRVSLLIKNMPVNDPEKYGSIKDNTFALVQGLNARVIALENQEKIVREKQSLQKLSSDVRDVMGSIKSSYQEVVRSIATEVDTAAEMIHSRVPHLALTEKDERFLEEVTENCILETTRIFNEGLRIEEIFEQLDKAIKNTLTIIESHSEEMVEQENKLQVQGAGNKPVELF